MATVISAPDDIETLGDLLDRLGGVDPGRIRIRPLPGTATEQDVVEIERRENRLYELVDGVLVEKAMGYPQSILALVLVQMVGPFVDEKDLGLLSGADGLMRLFPGLIRIPDVAFVRWQRVPGRRLSRKAIADMAPDLAIEILSEGNTSREMTRKLQDYFSAGASRVWLIDLDRREVSDYTDADAKVVYSEQQSIDGGELLPGFTLELPKLFAKFDRLCGEH